MHRSLRLTCLLASCLTALGGCDTMGPVLTPDTGVDAPRFTDGGPDDAPERGRPMVIETTPADGTSGAAGDVVIGVTFSESMRTGGTVSITADSVSVTADTVQSDDGTELSITPDAAFASGARVRVTLNDDFADDAGNTLAVPYTFTFDVGDFDAPTVLSSDPAQGSTDLSARLDAVTIVFSELMDSSVGDVVLSGGSGTLGTPRWIDGHTLRLPVSGLAYETTYTLTLTGFADTAMNALDPATYLVDGALTFATGLDGDAPQVLDSNPSEGQLNVSLRGTPQAQIVFDEPMNPSVGVATLLVGAETSVLPASFSTDGLTLTLAITGRLRPDAPHRITLVGFQDTSGNGLDPVAYLGDGTLDFDTGADVTAPVVVYSTPVEGTATTDHLLEGIEVVFDRGMDTDVTSLMVDDGVAPFAADVTWNLAGTIATLDVSEQVHTGRSYHVDLTSLVDLTGQPIVDDHPYLADGALDFGTRTPSGEQCRDEMTIAEATSMLPSGGYEWVFEPGSLAVFDDGASCRYPGGPTGRSPDAVIRYVKATPSATEGGRFLHVSIATTHVGDRASLAVYRGVCSAADPLGVESRDVCLRDRTRWDTYLDVGPGEYFIWGGQTDGSTLDGITMRIEEIDAIPEGEGCSNPFDTTSSIHSVVDGEDVWDVPAAGYAAPDMALEFPSEGAAVCDDDGVQGSDMVIEFDKASADTLLSVIIDTPLLTNFNGVNIEMRDACGSPGVPTPSLSCRPSIHERYGSYRLTTVADAGPAYVWVAIAEQEETVTPLRVRVSEVPNVPGSSCANAISLVEGVNPVSPVSQARLNAPNCMDVRLADMHLDDVITWYRTTTTAAATIFRTDIPGGEVDDNAALGNVALIDATSGDELGCFIDGSSIPFSTFLPPGHDVCVAVRGSSGISTITMTSVDYAGVGPDVTDLAILPPLNSTGGDVTITADTWMAITPTTLYMGVTTTGLLSASRAGGVRAELRTLSATVMGNAGLALGESVWSLDDSATAGVASRLTRLVNASGAATTTAWDGGFSWQSDAFDAMTYDGSGMLVANDGNGTVTVRRFDPLVPGLPTSLGVIATSEIEVTGIAADATWIYFAGRLGPLATAQRGVFRIRRSELGVATAELLAPVQVTSSGTSLRPRTPMVVDDTAGARHLYIRDGRGDVYVIADPGGLTPMPLGVIVPLGTSGDYAMTYDTATDELFLFENETAGPGRFLRVQ